MRFYAPLTSILDNKTKVACLRFLYKYPANLTGRELARMVKMAPTTIHKAMKELSHEQVVILRNVGNSHIYEINKDNLIVTKILIPMFKEENRLLADFLKHLARKIQGSSLKKRIISVALFGSVHERTEKPTSDIDLFVLVKETKDKKKIENLIFDLDSQIRPQTNMSMEPYIKTIHEFQKDKELGVIKSILKSHRIIWGRSLEVL